MGHGLDVSVVIVYFRGQGMVHRVHCAVSTLEDKAWCTVYTVQYLL